MLAAARRRLPELHQLLSESAAFLDLEERNQHGHTALALAALNVLPTPSPLPSRARKAWMRRLWPKL